MVFTCSISGEPAVEPVVSPVSGHVFEKRLIVKFIVENGTDPITNTSMDENQLVPLKSDGDGSVPRSTAQSSIPSLLKMLQDEWDTVMLNSFSQRQQLQTARQELSHSLYQHDAACRVIARLSKELTAAREALSTLKPHAQSVDVPETDIDMESVDETQGMSDAVINKLSEKAATLTAARKQRGKNAPEGLAKQEDFASFKVQQSHTGIHSTGVPGITAMDLSGSIVLTGGADKAVIRFDLANEVVLDTFKGHQKKINAVISHPNGNTAISASSDATVRVWNAGDEESKAIIDIHQAPVTDISLHATGDYILSTSDDSHWAFSDIQTGKTLCKVRVDDSSNVAVCCAEFHPDGLIFGTGAADSVVKIWDLKEQANVANFPGHTSSVKAIAFSENGYYLATGSEDGEVKLWDLRKLKNLKTIQLHDGKDAVNNITFDHSGTYLAVGSSDVQVLHVKSWQVVATFDDHAASVSAVRFGEDANKIYSVSMDKSLKMSHGNVTGTSDANHFKDGVIDFVAGTCGGIANVYTGQPLDTVKVKVQTFPKLYTNWVVCLKDTYRLDGIRGLYAGTLPALAANIAENAVLFSAYGYCQKLVGYGCGHSETASMTPVENALSGSLAAVFAAAVLCPTELVKCRLQAAREMGKQCTPFSVCRDMMKERGVRGFFTGMTPTLAREVPGYFCFFGAYETCRYMLTEEGQTKDEIGLLKTAVSGSIGGMALWASIFPADVVKSRMQVSGGGQFGTILVKIAKEEGIRGLYKGLLPTLIRTCVASGSLFVAYEETRKLMHAFF